MTLGETLLEFLGVPCIVMDIFATFRRLTKTLRHHQRLMLSFTQIRLKFGLWPALALEFQPGADIAI